MGQQAHHIVKPRWGELGHHRLRERVVRRLEQPKHHVIRPVRHPLISLRPESCRRGEREDAPELPDVVKPDFVRPYAEHAPERDEHGDDVRDDEHFLRADFPVPLNVPETERAIQAVSSVLGMWRARRGCVPGGGRDGLGEPEVGVIQERERELVVLADGDERARSIQPLQPSVNTEKADKSGQLTSARRKKAKR